MRLATIKDVSTATGISVDRLESLCARGVIHTQREFATAREYLIDVDSLTTYLRGRGEVVANARDQAEQASRNGVLANPDLRILGGVDWGR